MATGLIDRIAGIMYDLLGKRDAVTLALTILQRSGVEVELVAKPRKRRSELSEAWMKPEAFK